MRQSRLLLCGITSEKHHCSSIFLFFLAHPVAKGLEEYGGVVDPFNAYAGAAAAHGSVCRHVVYVAEEIGVRHAAAHVKRFVGQNEELLQNDGEIITLLKTQFAPFLWSEVVVMVANHKIFVPIEL